MGRWLLMLSGLLAWAVHFSGLYLIASLEAVVGGRGAWTLAAVILTVVCVAAAVTGGALAFRRTAVETPGGRLTMQVGLLGTGVGALAILWQSLALLLR